MASPASAGQDRTALRSPCSSTTPGWPDPVRASRPARPALLHMKDHQRRASTKMDDEGGRER